MNALDASVAGEESLPPGEEMPLHDLRHDLEKLHDMFTRLRETQERFARDIAEAASRVMTMTHAARQQGAIAAPFAAMPPREFFATLLELHRQREGHFGRELFGEPVWDILLRLMLARIDGKTVPLSDFVMPGGNPAPALPRHIEMLIEMKLIEAFDNPDDIKDPFMALSGETARRMAEFYRARTRG